MYIYIIIYIYIYNSSKTFRLTFSVPSSLFLYINITRAFSSHFYLLLSIIMAYTYFVRELLSYINITCTYSVV